MPREPLRCVVCGGPLSDHHPACVHRPGVTSASGGTVDHPAHYGGADDPYEAIKVIEAWSLNFALGNAAKYICRAGRKPGAGTAEDLRKAAWYLTHEAERIEKGGSK